MTGSVPLLAVPNVSEGRDPAAVEAIAAAFTASGQARLLDTHSDADHHRAVLTLAGRPGSLADALAAGAAEAVRRIDIGEGAGKGGEPRQHPHVGAVDVVPIVYLDPAWRGAACAEALVVAELIGRLGVPVFVYGELAGGRTRAELRRGGVEGLAERMRTGELRPDFGPRAVHPTAGATLVAARAPAGGVQPRAGAPRHRGGRAPDREPDPRGRRRGPPGGARDRGGAEPGADSLRGGGPPRGGTERSGLADLRSVGGSGGEEARDRAGLDERRAPRGDAPASGGRGGAQARRGGLRGARGLGPRGGAGRASRRTCRCPASTPRAT